MKDLEAAVEAGAEAASARPEGLVLQQSEGGGKTRWSFQDDEEPPREERPINADVAIKSCGDTIGVGLFARRRLVLQKNEITLHYLLREIRQLLSKLQHLTQPA